VEYANGAKEWWLNSQLHRTDGPAIEHPDGYRAWYLNGKRHRTDGPAVINETDDQMWYLDGHQYDLDHWLRETDDVSAEDKVMMKLKYG
jgi:hypothetical protein